jgi:hypothetical protein
MKNKPFLVPDLDNPIRWNSTFLMIEKLGKIRVMTDILIIFNHSLRENYLTESY